jgi:hypothetical protein
MIKLKLAVCFCCAFVLLCAEAAQGQNNNLEKAKELWEKVIAARGGRENLYAVKTLVVSTKSYNPANSKEFRNTHLEDLYVLPDKWWTWLDQRPGFPLGIRQYDFGKEIGYEEDDLSKGNNLSVFTPIKAASNFQEKSSEAIRLEKLRSERFYFFKQAFFEKQLLYLMETKSFQPVIESSRTERIKDKDFEVIEVSFRITEMTDGGVVKIEYFLDPKTYLPSRIRVRTWFEETKTYHEEGFYLEDYIEVKGIKFPQVIRRGKKTDSKTTYYVNEPYNETLFNQPPKIEAGAKGWKPKQ